jgi:hypothetical protein
MAFSMTGKIMVLLQMEWESDDGLHKSTTHAGDREKNNSTIKSAIKFAAPLPPPQTG